MVDLRHLYPRIGSFMIIFGALGVAAVLLTHASPATVSIEAEGAEVVAPAAIFNDDPLASGNSYVHFGPEVPPTPIPSLIPQICGTWALQQADDYNDLYAQFRYTIANSMTYSNIRGLSIRFPWKAGTDNADLINQFSQSKTFAAGHDYSIRFMAGRWTPQYVFDAPNSPFYWYDDPLDLDPQGNPIRKKIPKPFSDDGVAGNPAFENAFRETVAALATWSRANNVKLLHLPWYGQDWAELHHALNVRQAPGYSYDNWIKGHENLIDIALEYAGPRPDGTNLAVEFPMSGSGPLVGTLYPAIHQLSAHILEKAGPNSEKIFVQANGWGPAGWGYGDWGATDAATELAKDNAVWPKSVLRGEQAIQSDNNYNWSTMFDSLITNNAKYAEVYVNSFRTNVTPNSAEQLATKITEYKNQVCQ